jgi:chromobox protein 1
VKEWSPPAGSWEDEVDFVETVEETPNKSGQPEKNAYIVWKNGKKTMNSLPQLYQKCPQKMLIYYERHL